MLKRLRPPPTPRSRRWPRKSQQREDGFQTPDRMAGVDEIASFFLAGWAASA